MFHFFILAITLPLWAYEKPETRQTKLPSSPIQIYESQDKESAEQVQAQAQAQAQAQTKEEENIPIKQEQQPVIIIREQPSVQVYSEPPSPQDKLSRARKEAEQQTENKIRTRLELLRLKDEKARMDQLLSPLEDEHISVQQPQQKPAPEQQKSLSTRTRKYFIHLGMGHLNHYTQNSPHPKSIERIGASFTGGFGLYDAHKFSIEYTLNFSKHQILYPLNNPHFNPTYIFFDLYSHSLALKYYILSGSIKPFIGAVASINQRDYKTLIAKIRERDPDFYWDKRISTALQGAFTTGAELFITQNIVVGLDLRIYMNIYDLQDLWVKKTNHYYHTIFPAQQPLPEEMSWYNLQGFFRILW